MLSFIRRTLLQPHSTAAVETQSDRTFVERRKSLYPCVDCLVWTPTRVFLSDGREYCLSCAKKVSGMYGAVPAGSRASDIAHAGAPHVNKAAGS